MSKKGRKSGFGSGERRRSHSALTRALVASTTGALVASNVLNGGMVKVAKAQGVESVVRSTQGQSATYTFDIPAGSLEDILRAFQDVTRVKLELRLSVVDLESDGVKGEFTAQRALSLILAKSGLTFVFGGANSAVINPGHAQSGKVLSGVSVVGARAPGSVSSAKYPRNGKDIPQTVTVVPQEVIKSQNITSLRDVVRNVPGITMNAGEGGNYPGDKFNVRGFTAQNDMFVDGVRDVGAYSRDIFNVEQVEVTKGPNSSISGRGSTGGSINLVTKTPKAFSLRTANLSVGSADQRRVSVDLNQSLAPIGFSDAAVRLNAVSSQGGVAGNEVVRNKSWGVAPSLAIGLGDATQVNVALSRSQQDNIPSYGLSTFDSIPSVDTRKFYGLRSLDFEKVSAHQQNVRVAHQFSNGAHIQNQTIRGSSKVDRIVTPVNPVSGSRSPKTHVYNNTIVSNQTNLNLAFATGGIRHYLTTGFEYGYEKSERGSIAIGTSAPPVLDITNPSSDADFYPTLKRNITRQVRATSLSAYAFETFSIGSKVDINAGARWDSYDPEYVDSASQASGFAARKSSSVSARGSIVVNPVQQGNVYVSYGTSFNPSNENLALDGLSSSSDLDPEKSRSYEVGSKWELFKQRLLASVAFFRTEKTNARTPDPDDPAVTVLAAKQRVEGFEVGVTGSISPKVSIYAGYSNLDGETVSAPDTTRNNQPFTNVPRHSVNIWSTFNPTPALSLGAGARYIDKRLLRQNASGSIYVPSYHTYDAVASVKVNPMVDIQLNLYNISDKLYYDSGRMWAPAAGRSVTLGTSIKL